MQTDDNKLIHHFLEVSAARLPDKVALVHEDVRATYQQINSRANCLAELFVAQGIVPGDRIVLLLNNSLEYVVSYYAALKVGAVVAPMNTELKAEGILPILQELDAKCLVSARKFERLLRNVDLSLTTIQFIVLKQQKLDLLHDVNVIDWDEVVGNEFKYNLNIKLSSTALGSIIYTSGSTGRPKGVMLSHGNIVANVNSICEYLHLTDRDIQMVVQPFFYVMGKSLLNTHFAVGGTVVINNKFAYPATIIKQMVKEKVTGFSGVPSTYAYLLHQSPLEASRNDLIALRYCSQAGGHMSSVTKEKLLAVLPEHTQFFVMYGATEASARLAYVEPKMLTQKMDSIGKPIPGVTLKILDKNGKERPVGQVGEIVASGKNIMKGYWRNPAATEEALSRHGYHTGDLGYRDTDGYFFVVGRKDNQLKVGGHRINTPEIEDVIMASGMVVEATVLGIPDLLLGHKLVAMVVPSKQGLKNMGVLGFCSKRLPAYKVPSEVLQVNALPKSASGKIDKAKCADVFRVSSQSTEG